METHSVYQKPEAETMFVAVEQGFAGSHQVDQVQEGEEY